MRLRIYGLTAFCACLLIPSPLSPKERTEGAGPLRAIGYYLAVGARVGTPDAIVVFGHSNLPAGSVLWITIYDVPGPGQKDFSEPVSATVGPDGVFRVTIHPKKGMEFRRDSICYVFFSPTWPKQPPSVLRVIGRRGERLESPATNPQVGISSGGAYLVAYTIVQ